MGSALEFKFNEDVQLWFGITDLTIADEANTRVELNRMHEDLAMRPNKLMKSQEVLMEEYGWNPSEDNGDVEDSEVIVVSMISLLVYY